MATRLSRGSLEVFSNNPTEINLVLQRIREELDEIQGLRGRALISDALEIDGDLNHDGVNIGFFGTAPVAKAPAYTVTNVTTDRSYNADAVTLDEIADVLGTLIADLKAYGLLA